MPVPFDTLKFFDRLVDGGVPREQAKAQTEALLQALFEFEAYLNQQSTCRHADGVTEKVNSRPRYSISQLMAECDQHGGISNNAEMDAWERLTPIGREITP